MPTRAQQLGLLITVTLLIAYVLVCADASRSAARARPVRLS